MNAEPQVEVVELELEESPRMPSPGVGARHLMVGMRNGKVVEDEPFDEIRLVENPGTSYQIIDKGILK